MVALSLCRRVCETTITIMSCRSLLLYVLWMWLGHCHAFSLFQQLPRNLIRDSSTTTTSSCRMAQVALEPEPDGGEELMPVTSTLAGCRMKNMGPATETTSDLGKVYQFWMVAQAEGTLVKEYHTQLLKDASKKANFPGFRKGQVPPFALPKIVYFAVREAIIKTVEGAVKGFGLKSLPGSDGEVKVNEDTEAMCKVYRLGDSLHFTATLKAVFDPDVVKPTTTTTQETDGAEATPTPEDGSLSASPSLD